MILKSKPRSQKPRQPKWKEMRRTEISPDIHIATREGLFTYAARRWIVQELSESVIEGVNTVSMRERVETGTPLYAHEAPGLVGDIIETAARMNDMLMRVLRERCPEEERVPVLLPPSKGKKAIG